MGQVTSLTAAAMQEVADNSVVSGAIDGNGHLELTTAGGDVIDAGQVVGPTGPQGPPGPPGSSAGIPTGGISMYGATIPPSGWLVCDGSAVSRTTYAALFAVISTIYGAGDGVTTFNLPNFSLRTPRQDNANIGLKGGAVPGTHSHTIDGGSAPAVAHLSAVTGPDNNLHIERISTASYTANFDIGVQNGTLTIAGGSNAHTNGVKVTGTTSPTTAPSTATDALNPFLNVNFIIKT